MFLAKKSIGKSFENSANHKGEIVVIKIGGDLMNRESVLKISAQVADLHNQGAKPIVVHGGKPAIDEALEAKDMLVHQNYETGMRTTSLEALRIVDEVLQRENKNIVDVIAEVLDDENKVMGLAAYYNNLVKATKAVGHYSGRATIVNTQELTRIIEGGKIPVINPTCANESYDEYDFRINPNGDDVAMRIFNQMSSKGRCSSTLMLCSATNVLDKDKNPITELDFNKINKLINSGVIRDGMIIKVKDALNAAYPNPESRVFIINGNADNALLNAYKNHGNTATLIKSPAIANENKLEM